MKYNFILIGIFLSLISCTGISNKKISSNLPILEKFNNSGFTLIYENKLFQNKIINKKINERDLIIFQKNLKKGTSVKIINPFNGKTLIAKVLGIIDREWIALRLNELFVIEFYSRKI